MKIPFCIRLLFLFLLLLTITLPSFGQERKSNKRMEGFNKPIKSNKGPQKKSGDLSQTVFGVVFDEHGGQPLDSVTVIVQDSISEKSGMTDEKGFFSLDGIPIGRHTLKAGKPGYNQFVIAGLEVNGGKATYVEIPLEERIANLDSVIIMTDNTRQLSGVSTRTFTVEETRRFAATNFDPARLATSFPGVTNANDQANHLSVRGNSPNGLLWRLEGVDIVNPNHLTNAGTFSDRPSLQGGGVNMLSTQMMGNSTFSTGAFGSKYGNVLGGVMDINLRKGQTARDFYTLQAGLLGIDLAAEGPMGEKGVNSFLANYRYSTVGLLTAAGVDFGGESIAFQDLSFNMAFPTEKLGTFTVFGLWGNSKNTFQSDRDSIRTEKDLFDIVFKSRMYAFGASHKALIGKKTLWETAVARSEAKSTREGYFITDSTESNLSERDILQQGQYSVMTSLRRKFNSRLGMVLGGSANFMDYTLEASRGAFTDTLPLGQIGGATGSTMLAQPYLTLTYRLSDKLKLDAGVHGMYLALNGATSIEPRASLNYKLLKNQEVTLAYGLHSQMQPLNLYFTPLDTTSTPGMPTYINDQLDFTKAHHIVLSYVYRLNKSLSIKVEPYYQSIFNVPIVNDTSSSFSALNIFEGIISDTLSNLGTGTNYGVELSVEKTMDKGYYYLVSGTYYDSKYVGGDGVERDTRYNGNYTMAVTAGKEFTWKKAAKTAVIGIDARLIYQGGYRYTPIDSLGSSFAGTTVYQDNLAFSEKLDDYFRLDIRISHTKNKKDFTRVIAIDIQNATNKENIAYQYFDTAQQDIVSKFQLGIIPLLTYRLEF